MYVNAPDHGPWNGILRKTDAMENLKELIYIVNQNKIKKIELLDLSDKNCSRVNRLYQAISKGEVDSDEDAFERLFKGQQSKSAYRNLKVQLRKRLINTLFFIDAYKGGTTDRQTAYFELQKDFAAAQLLMAKNARHAGVDLMERLLKAAEHYEFTDLVFSICRILRLHYGAQLGDEKKYEEYQQLYVRYREIDHLENKAEEYYSDLILYYVKDASTKAALQSAARRYYEELAPSLGENATYKLYFYTSLVRLFQYTCINDYPGAVPVCDEIIRFFEDKPFEANTPIQICLHHQLVAYLQLGLYEQGENVAVRSEKMMEAGSFNWFKNLEYLFLLAMHTGNYQRAYTVFRKAVDHKRFSTLPEPVAELWNLYHAYLHFLIELGKIAPEEGDRHFTAFRINRFLNDMPIFSKDKKGMNIAVLSIQILFYILRGNYNTAIDRIEAIEKYCSRYLFKEHTLRSYYFIKLLLTIPQASFHRTAVARHARPYLEKLRAFSIEEATEFHKIEIIPYETLWALILDTLHLKIYRTPKEDAGRSKAV